MNGFRDIHAHFVYGVDDGARTRADMEAMLDAAHADGVASLFATPHVTPGIAPFDERLFHARLAEARGYCAERGYPLTLYAGAEILYTPAMERYASEHRLPTLADSEYVLMEFVPDIAYVELDATLGQLERSGYTAILAHIERYRCMSLKNAYRLKEKYDICYQINCGTLLRKQRFFKAHRVERWLKDELIDFVATDSHDTLRRPSRMTAAYECLRQHVKPDYAMRLVGLGTDR